MKGKLLLCTAALTGVLFASCNKDEDTSPDVSSDAAAGLGYQLRATNTVADIGQNAAYGALQWTSGFANPREIKFEAKPAGNNGNGNNGNGNGHGNNGNGHGNGNGNGKIEYKSTYTSPIDLFAPASTVFGAFTLPPGTYKEIELKMKLEGDNTTPALQLNGMYNANNYPAVPVTLVVPEDFEIKTEMKDVTIDNSMPFSAITSLDLASFTSGITPAMLQNAQLTNGTLLISPTSNRNMYDIIMNNLTSKRHSCDVKKNR